MKKRILSALLSLVFVVNMMGPLQVYSANQETNTYCTWETITACREKHSAPDIAGTDGKVFAGWYEDETYKSPLEVDKVVDGAYAKFVDANTLSAKGQITKGTTADDAVTALRLLTTVDSLYYESVGFQVEANGRKQLITSKIVYETVNTYTKENDITKYTPKEAFCSDSEYFMTYEIQTVPNSFFGDGFKVTPIWTTMDGIVVTGQTRTLKIYAGLEDKISAEELSYGTLWSAPSTVKIGNTDSISSAAVGEAVSEVSGLSYTAVRNEYESAQLVLTANQSVDAYALYATDLVGETERILAENVDVYTQKYVTYTGNTRYPEGGTMPDALLPMDAADAYGENSIKANQNGILWVTTYIPKGVAAGTYTGNFLLVVDGTAETEVIKIPVTFEVVDYTLTDEVNAKTLFSWRYDRVAPGELDGSLSMMEEYYEFFLDYRISLQSLPLGTLSGTEIKDALQKYGDCFSTFTLLTSIGDISMGVANAERETLFKEQIYAIAEASGPDNNFFEKAMCYSTDEPHMYNEGVPESLTKYYNTRTQYLTECVEVIEADTTGRFDTFKQLDESEWKASILNIPDVIPISYNSTKWVTENKDDENVVAFLAAINCLCPIFNVHGSDFYEDFVELCNSYDIELWWYGCTDPITPYPTYHISDPNLLSSRSVSWMQKKYDIQGNLYWDAAAYTDENFQQPDTLNEYLNVYEFPFHYSHAGGAAGDGFLSYPGAAYGVSGPIPSVRLMSIRDGMEEYEILCDVENLYAEKSTAGDFGTTIDVDATMDSIFYRTLYSEGLQMNADGTVVDFTGLREKLLNMTSYLNNGLGYAMSKVEHNFNFSISAWGYKAKFTCYVENGSTLYINGSQHTSGQSYTTSSIVDANTTVTIQVVNAAGESVTYTQHVGRGLETTATSSSVAVETSGRTKTEQTYNAEENSELLLSFDSYANITGAGLRVSKLLGETQVNTDAQYITEGTGSWMIRPEGDYSTTNDYPWFKMRLTDVDSDVFMSTIATDDFSDYKKILLDVYNASDEEVRITINFTAYANESTYLDTGARMFVLEPYAWTVCEYELTDAMFSSYVNLEEPVKYMQVSFLDKKASRDAELYTLYFDNLRGVLGTRDTAQYSFTEGIDFEDASDVGIFKTSQGGHNSVDKSHVSYADTELADSAALLGLGQSGMRADVTNSVWPTFSVKLDKTYEAGKIVSFWLYMEAEPTKVSGRTYIIESSNLLTGEKHTVLNGNCGFNRWVQIHIQLADASDYLKFHINLDNYHSGTPMLGDTLAYAYLDEFKVIDSIAGDTMEASADGILTIKDADDDGAFNFVYEQGIEQGQRINFDLDTNSAGAVTVSALSDGSAIVYEKTFDSWSGVQNIGFFVDSDMDFLTIRVTYDNSDSTTGVCTISNFAVRKSGLSAETSPKDDEDLFGDLLDGIRSKLTTESTPDDDSTNMGEIFG